MEQISDYVLRCVLLCFFAGFFLGLFYSVLKMLRIIFGMHKLGTAILDVLFFAVAAVVTFLTALAMDHGRTRFFQIGIELIGFCIFLLLFDPLLTYPTQKIYKIVTKISRFFKVKYRNFFKRRKTKQAKERKKSKKHAKNREKAEKSGKRT